MSGYSDWYLPAICEMGYGANGGGVNCGTSSAPTLQNMQSNLIDTGTDVAGLTTGPTGGQYWSSTEYSSDPTTSAWAAIFRVNNQYPLSKGVYNIGVRCSRALTL